MSAFIFEENNYKSYDLFQLSDLMDIIFIILRTLKKYIQLRNMHQNKEGSSKIYILPKLRYF